MSAFPEHSIAVIGMAGRFPGASDTDEFWQHLRDGRESIRRFSAEECRLAGLPERLVGDPAYVRARGVLEGASCFDAGFFGLGPRQARILDPQQRIWLECVQSAFEDAGTPVQPGNETVGVFAGARESTYLLGQLGSDPDLVDLLLHHLGADGYQIFIANDKDSVATRTSFLFDLTGPSINIQSACSTSLVAVAQACLSLSNYQCDVSIAGGVCVTFPSVRGYLYQPEGIHSPDGRCRAFDSRAEGVVFGDGVGVVVLKRLEDALRDNDRVDAVIRGWAVNNDGADKASFTAPSTRGQAEVIALAQELAGVHPSEIGYVEAHGTGTKLGDPLEVAALTEAFRRHSREVQFCGLGSVKPNIGHLDTAAGIAGFIKTVLMLKHQQLPPTLHFSTPNPRIDFAGSPFYVVDRLRDWHTDDGARRIAGVSAFGVGGTNCHVILEEAPPRTEFDRPGHRPVSLLTLSAKTERALSDLARRYVHHLSDNEHTDLESVAVTTNTSRSGFDWRLAVSGSTVAEVIDRLDDFSDSTSHTDVCHGLTNPDESPGLGFLFTGQGSQYSGMSRQLYEVEPEFHRALERCDELLRPHLECRLVDVLYSDDAGSLLDRADYAQPALFALEYALIEMWRSWGVEPSWVMGQSLGEYAAACAAGVIDLEEALTLVAERGRLMNALPPGGRMLAVFADPDRVEGTLRSAATGVVVAAINTPNHVVISGMSARVEEAATKFRREGIQCLDVPVSHAFHSPLMDPVLDSLEQCVARRHLKPPTINFVSNLSGESVTDGIATAAYWRDQSRQPVMLSKGLQTMAGQGCKIFLEVGPHGILTAFGRETIEDGESVWLPSLRRGRSDWSCLMETVGELYVRGVSIDWAAVNRGRTVPPVRLPTYPFQRERYWIAAKPRVVTTAPSTPRSRDQSVNPMLGARVHLPAADEIRFETRYSPSSPSYLRDHRLFDAVVVPGASHVALLVQGAEGALGPRACRFHEVFFERPMLLSEDSARIIQLVLSRPLTESVNWRLQLMSALESGDVDDNAAWSVHVSGKVTALSDGDPAADLGRLDLEDLRRRATDTVSRDEFYTNVWGNAQGTGQAFRWIDSIWKGDGEAIARTLQPSLEDRHLYYRVHPGVIEAAFQVIHCCKTFETVETINTGGVIWVPFSIDELFFGVPGSVGDEVWCYAKMRDYDTNNVVVDLCLTDEFGKIAGRMVGLCLRKLSRDASIGHGSGDASAGGPVPVVDVPVADEEDLRQRLSRGSAEEQRSVLLDYLLQTAARVSGHATSALDPGKELMSSGFDSLMAISLANRIQGDLQVTVPVGRLLSATIEALVEELHRLWLLSSASE